MSSFISEDKNNIMKIKNMKFRPLKGTRDFLPEEMILRQKVIEKIKSIFEIYGFQPLETPAIESWDVLSAKGAGGEEILKETFTFEDKGKRKVGLRYDLTVPLARVIASNTNLALPFKRYQIEKVWRYGDVSKGRLREFLQCDIDTIGSESMLADAEIISCAVKIFEELGFKDFFVRINNRKLLTALLKYAGIKEGKVLEVLRAIDKLEKIGGNGVKRELKRLKISEGSIEKIFEFIELKGEAEEVIEKVKYFVKDFKEGKEGVSELEELVYYLEKMGAYSKVKIDLSLARGLDYYTGPIFEVFTPDGIGSLAGGGRYDKLIGLFLGRDVPATGISLGIERIIEIMKDKKMLEPIKSKTKVFVAAVNEKVREKALEIVQNLRENFIPSDFDLKNRNLTRQLEYVDSLNIPFVVIVGEKEVERGMVKIRDMKNRKEMEVKIQELVDFFYKNV